MRYRIQMTIAPAYKGLLHRPWLRRLVAETLAREGAPPAEVGLVITDDETVRHLHQTYLGEDSPTDVLAFSLREGPAFPHPEDDPLPLGEVVISYPQAKRQAEEHGHSTEEEVALLVLHGLLHLLGYDHLEEEEAKTMRERESQHLKDLLGKE